MGGEGERKRVATSFSDEYALLRRAGQALDVVGKSSAVNRFLSLPSHLDPVLVGRDAAVLDDFLTLELDKAFTALSEDEIEAGEARNSADGTIVATECASS